MDYLRSSRRKMNGRRLNGNPNGKPSGESADTDEAGDLLDAIDRQSSDGGMAAGGGRAATSEDIENSLDSSNCSLDGHGSGPSSPRVVGGATRGSAPSSPQEVGGATRGSGPSSPREVGGATRGSAPSSPRAGAGVTLHSAPSTPRAVGGATRGSGPSSPWAGVARGSAPSSPWAGAGVARGSAPQGWCPGCQKVWQKARHMRRPLKDKLLDQDPSSLTCDQWVLKKRWRPRGGRVLKSQLKDSLKLLHRRRGDVVRGRPTCSRAHAFLRRNLRLRATPSAQRGRGRKRKGAWWTTRSVKRPRSEPPRPEPQPPTDLPPADGSHGDSEPSTLDSWSEEEEEEQQQQGPAHVAPERVPSPVTVETAKTGGFKHLLSQLRGNSRTVVKEDGQ